MRKSSTSTLDTKSDSGSHPKRAGKPSTRFLIKELEKETWPDFARFFENRRHTWSGCWCVGFHLKPGEPDGPAPRNRALKEKLVKENRTHNALVYDGPDLVGWCQFGPPAELPARMRGYGKLDAALPDWRITCFVVDKDRRGEGIAKAALEGALQLIADKGGGTVDGYPIDIPEGKPYADNWLWSGTTSMFTKQGFRRLGQFGSSKWVMRKAVPRR